MNNIPELYKDTIKELVNIGIGKGADVLNQMLNTHINLSVPEIKIMNNDKLKNYINEKYGINFSYVTLPFSGNISGKTKLIFPIESAKRLTKIFGDNEFDEDLDNSQIRAGILSEIGNIVINAVIGTLSNELSLTLNYTVPSYFEASSEMLVNRAIEFFSDEIILCQTNFNIEQLNIQGELILFFELGVFNDFISMIKNYLENV